MLDDVQDERSMTMAQVIEKRDRQIAKLERNLGYAHERIQEMERMMARSFPSIAEHCEVTCPDIEFIRVRGPETWVSMLPAWEAPKPDRLHIVESIMRTAAEAHCMKLYASMARAWNEKRNPKIP